MADLVTVATEPGGAVGQVALALLLADRHAEVGAIVDAVDALAALRAEEGDDVIADLEVANPGAHRLDDAGSLVSENRGGVAGRVDA